MAGTESYASADFAAKKKRAPDFRAPVRSNFDRDY